MPCPVCGLAGGFHDTAKHNEHEVPRHLLLEPGWHKEKESIPVLLTEVLLLADAEVNSRISDQEIERRLQEVKATAADERGA